MADQVQPKYPGAKCSECPYLHNTAFVPPLFSVKPPKILVLGESPGPKEAKTGIPFTGPSGQLLTAVLNHYGIDQGSVIKNNTTLCRPFGPTEKPPKKAIECCSDRLHNEIKESGVEYILAVGNTAAQAVLDDKRTITHVRVGDPKPYKFDSNIRVVASVHPAFCLRSPDNFPTFVKDVGKLVAPPTKPWTPPQFKVFEDPQVAREALRRLIKHTDRAVIDIEVGVEKDLDYAHPEDYEMLCTGIAYDKGKAVVLGKHAMADLGVRELMAEYFANVKLIGHNGKFDLRGLYPLIGLFQLWFDTMLASRALDERPGNHGLTLLAVERLGAPKYDDNIRRHIPRGGNYADVPLSILYEYNAYDVGCTWDIHDIFIDEMDTRARKEHDFMVAASNAIINLELAGVPFDHEYNQELAFEYQRELAQLEEKLNGIIGRTLNPRSPKQITEFFATKNLHFPTTSADFLTEAKLVIKDPQVVEFIDQLLVHRKASKLYGTYVKGLASKTTRDKVYTTYTLHSTTSGRLASKGPNMQNIHKDRRIRNQFTTEHPDNRLIQIDYSQIEGRVIATYAKDYYLAGIFNDASRDLFNELIHQIYGDRQVYDARRKIKSVWYGFCVPVDTKILTRRGWLTYDQVIPNVDETIGYDPKLKRSRWTSITNVVTFKDQEIIRFGHSDVQFEATPNHRWFSELPKRKLGQGAKRHNKRSYYEEFVTTEGIKAEHILQLAKPFSSDTKLDISVEEASLLGWALSGGTLKITELTGATAQGFFGERQGVIMRLHQNSKNKDNVAEIDRILTGYPSSKYEEQKDGSIVWNIPAATARNLLRRATLLNDSGKYQDTDPIQFSLSLSDEQRGAFLQAVFSSYDVKGKPKTTKNSSWLTEVIQTIGYLDGYLVKSYVDASSKLSTNLQYRHWLAEPTLSGQLITKDYLGKKDVWCVETELGTWTMRQNGLTVLTGNSYGRKALSIAKELDLPFQEAFELVEGFKRIVPATVAWQEKIKRAVLSGEDLTTPFGRRRVFHLITNDNREDVLNEALSFLPQSTASDICVSALIALTPVLRDLAIIRMTIHDALVFETHHSKVDDVIHIASTEMIKAAENFGDFTKFAVDVTVGNRLGEI